MSRLKIILPLITASILLQSCLPVIFVGATGTAMQFAKDRSAADTIKDAQISASIKAELLKDNFRALYARINIEVIGGRVLFTGKVEKEEDSLRAVNIAWQQEGVVEVVNELRVDSKSNHFDLVQYTKDMMITSQIKSKLLVHRDVKLVNYTIITSDNYVYLFGMARSPEELEKVADIAANINGVEKVISNVRIMSEDEVKANASNDNKDEKVIKVQEEDSAP